MAHLVHLAIGGQTSSVCFLLQFRQPKQLKRDGVSFVVDATPCVLRSFFGCSLVHRFQESSNFRRRDESPTHQAATPESIYVMMEIKTVET
jgi:hypothetical protein